MVEKNLPWILPVDVDACNNVSRRVRSCLENSVRAIRARLIHHSSYSFGPPLATLFTARSLSESILISPSSDRNHDFGLVCKQFPCLFYAHKERPLIAVLVIKDFRSHESHGNVCGIFDKVWGWDNWMLTRGCISQALPDIGRISY
jgi:hypothetical protein